MPVYLRHAGISVTRKPRTAKPAPRRAAKELLHGINSVEQALRARKRRTHKLYLKEGTPSNRLGNLRSLAEGRNVPLAGLPGDELEQLCGSPNHQGAVLECGPLPVETEAEALVRARRPGGLLLALDQVSDPQNLGAAARNGAAFGVDGLAIPRHESAPLSAAASRASAGRLEHLPVFDVGNMARFLENCRKAGIWIAGADQEGDTALPEFDPAWPLVVVMGSEQKGLRPLVRSRCDYVVTIPSPGGGSLNVAAATAIVLYHVSGRRP